MPFWGKTLIVILMNATNNTNTGTCPFCFRSFKAKNGQTSRHGYKYVGGRKGWGGWQQGACGGAHYPRFEDSTEGTVVALAQVNNALEAATEYRAKLDTRPALEWAPRLAYNCFPKDYAATRTLLDGCERVVGSNRSAVPSYDEVLKAAIAKTDAAIRNFAATATTLEEKIATWVAAA